MNKLINQLSTAAAASSTSSATTTTTTATSNPTPSIDFTSLLQSTILQSLTAVANALSSAPQSSTSNNETSEKLTQALNTITSQLNQHQAQTSQSTNATDSVPEYRPTPIAELERRRRVHQKTVKSNLNKGNFSVILH